MQADRVVITTVELVAVNLSAVRFARMPDAASLIYKAADDRLNIVFTAKDAKGRKEKEDSRDGISGTGKAYDESPKCSLPAKFFHSTTLRGRTYAMFIYSFAFLRVLCGEELA